MPTDTHTLAGEHAALLCDVERRATPVLAALDARTWPHAELRALINSLRATLLRQVSDEETLLFQTDSSAAPLAELNSDHFRLHTLTTRLEAVHAEPCSRGELRALVDHLLATLRRHLADEQDVLAALLHAGTTVPSAADRAAGKQAWLPRDDAPVLIRLDTLPEAAAVRPCIERLLRLRPGQAAEVHAAGDGQLQAPRPVDARFRCHALRPEPRDGRARLRARGDLPAGQCTRRYWLPRLRSVA